MILPALQQKGKVDRFTFQGKSLEQVEAEDGLIVHLDHQMVCLSVKKIWIIRLFVCQTKNQVDG